MFENIVTTNVLFVCLGNICRSPTAEAVFRHLVVEAGLEQHFTIDSAGTGDWNVGKPPFPDSSRVAAQHGVTLTGTARQLQTDELSRWDYIVVMDEKNKADVLALQEAANLPAAKQPKVVLLRDFDPQGPGIVPDPYGHDEEAFQKAYRQIFRASQGLLAALQPTADDAD